MEMVLLGILGLMLLGAFGVAFMSAKTWPVYQVVLVVFLFIGTTAMFYLTARVLATHASWRGYVKKTQQEIERREKEIAQLFQGAPGAADDSAKGIKQLQLDLAKMTEERGGVLFGATAQGVRDGVLAVKPASSDHGLAANAVLFVFEEKPQGEGGHYLGEFKVTGVADEGATVQLTPNLPLTAAQTQRLDAARGALTMYTRMPIDDTSVAGGAQRTLRDYEYLFHEGYLQRSQLSDDITRLQSNLDRTNASIKSTEEESAFRQAEMANLKIDLARYERERDAIESYLATLEGTLIAVRNAMRNTYASNREMDAALTDWQLRAARDLNSRPGGVPAGGPFTSR